MMDSRSSSRAMISVIERARGRSEKQHSSYFLSVSLIALFFITLIGCLGAGAVIYRHAARTQLKANNLHLESGLVTNIIRSNDVAGALSEGDGPEGPALVLSRSLVSGTYETRLYQYKGQLLQEFTLAGRPYDPKEATALLQTDTFSFEVNGDLVTFTTDAGSFEVCLRSDADAVQEQAIPSPEAGELVTIVDGGGLS